MFTRTLSALAAAVLTVGTVAFAVPAHAAGIDDASVSVRIGDLNLADEKDVAQLHRRVRAAARQICGATPVNNLSMQAMVAACHEQVLANAKADVDTAIASARASGDRLALRTR